MDMRPILLNYGETSYIYYCPTGRFDPPDGSTFFAHPEADWHNITYGLYAGLHKTTRNVDEYYTYDDDDQEWNHPPNFPYRDYRASPDLTLAADESLGKEVTTDGGADGLANHYTGGAFSDGSNHVLVDGSVHWRSSDDDEYRSRATRSKEKFMWW